MILVFLCRDESNPLWPNPMWLKDPEDLHQNQLQDHQNHHQPQLVVVLGVVLVVLELVLM